MKHIVSSANIGDDVDFLLIVFVFSIQFILAAK